MPSAGVGDGEARTIAATVSATVTRPPLGVNFTAFDRRLATT